MKILALDLGKFNTMCCYFDTKTRKHEFKTLICSTNEDAWSWSNVKRKTDKDDALKLARMAAMNELDIELTQLDSLTAQLDVAEKKLEAIGKNDPRIVRLRTIPGVGPRTAEILVACIDDPHRFENGRQVSAYFGLVPRQYQSGETDRNGRITKRGNPLARTILVATNPSFRTEPPSHRTQKIRTTKITRLPARDFD